MVFIEHSFYDKPVCVQRWKLAAWCLICVAVKWSESDMWNIACIAAFSFKIWQGNVHKVFQMGPEECEFKRFFFVRNCIWCRVGFYVSASAYVNLSCGMHQRVLSVHYSRLLLIFFFIRKQHRNIYEQHCCRSAWQCLLHIYTLLL